MGSDIARVSYDESRHYRSVVMQQGRVTLEADWNEAQLIATEEQRREALDIVGPAGTPHDGYRVLETGKPPAVAFDFQVGPGTMYVGGLRIQLDAQVDYVKQSDWLDHTTDPDWVDPATLGNAPGHEWIGVLLREQEVSAVEDSALREVALGGPDTAQRTRLLQHIVRVATGASDCAGGLASATTKWAAEGLAPDATTMRLNSGARLRVSFPPVKSPPDPCEPQPVGGYLSADNQLIRVQIAAPDVSGQARFVWGFDDASFLYGVDVLDSGNVRLRSAPPDAFRQPRAGQAVEILGAAASLGGDDYVAAPTGALFTLTKPYDPDGRTVALPVPGLGPVFLSTAATPAVYLRVWEEVKPITPGAPILLGQTGVEVTLQAPGNIFHVGDFWQFAVRPATATAVYPHRYLDPPQPPDGPRLWFCSLAVIQWTGGVLHTLADCRKQFDDLVTLTHTRLGGCCTVSVSPADLDGAQTLQAVLDRFRNQERVTICLMPGHYKLSQPLRLGPEHSNLTIEACHDGAVLEAADGTVANFLDGLVVLDHANNVTLRGLRFHLPQVPFQAAGGKLAGLNAAALRQLRGLVLADLFVSVGVRAIHCAVLAVEGCLFRFSLTENKDVFGVGLFGGSECWGLRVVSNRFLHEEDYLRGSERLFRFLVGYVLTPTASSPTLVTTNVPIGAASLVRTVLDNAAIDGNFFQGLSIAAYAISELGTVQATGNTVRDCDAGFWFMSTGTLVLLRQLSKVTARADWLAAGQTLAGILHAIVSQPIVELGTALALSYPLPAGAATTHPVPLTVTATSALVEARATSALQRMFDRILPTLGLPPVPVGGAASGQAAALRARAQRASASTTAAEEPVHEAVVTDAAMTRAAVLNQHVLAIAQAAVAPADSDRLTMAMTISGNQIDTVLAGTSGSSGVLVWDDERDARSTLAMNANTVASFSDTLPAAAISFVDSCTVTGNILTNTSEAETARSLALTPLPNHQGAAAVAVTGNVFHGLLLLPLRPATTPATPPPMDSWLFFNTVV